MNFLKEYFLKLHSFLQKVPPSLIKGGARMFWCALILVILIAGYFVFFMDPNKGYVGEKIDTWAVAVFGDDFHVDGMYDRGFVDGGAYVSATDVDIPWPIGSDNPEDIYHAKEMKVGYSVARALTGDPNVYVEISGLDYYGKEIHAEFWVAWDVLNVWTEIISLRFADTTLAGNIFLGRSGPDAPWRDISGFLRAEILEISSFLKAVPAEEDKADKIFNRKAFRQYNVDLDFDVQEISINGVRFGEFKGHLKTPKPGLIEFIFKDALLSGGRLNGTAVLDATGDVSRASLDLKVEGFDYGLLARSNDVEFIVEGTMDIAANLASQAPQLRTEELYKRWDGKISVVGESGRIGHSGLNFWAKDIISYIPVLGQIREDRPTMDINCVVANMQVKDGRGKLKNMLLDTRRLTVVGAGNYNFFQNSVDIVLKPQPKDIKLLDLSSPIRISGPITHPQASPEVVGAAKKLGELFLSTVNPLALVIPVVKGVLTDQNPCVEALKKIENQKQPETGAN